MNKRQAAKWSSSSLLKQQFEVKTINNKDFSQYNICFLGSQIYDLENNAIIQGAYDWVTIPNGTYSLNSILLNGKIKNIQDVLYSIDNGKNFDILESFVCQDQQITINGTEIENIKDVQIKINNTGSGILVVGENTLFLASCLNTCYSIPLNLYELTGESDGIIGTLCNQGFDFWVEDKTNNAYISTNHISRNINQDVVLSQWVDGKQDSPYVLEIYKEKILFISQNQRASSRINKDLIIWDFKTNPIAQLSTVIIPNVTTEKLTFTAGTTVLEALKQIISQLGGNYECFFDAFGIFHFQEIKNFLNIGSASEDLVSAINEKYFVIQNKDKITYELNNTMLISAFQNNPNYNKIKNYFQQNSIKYFFIAIHKNVNSFVF